MPRTGIHKWRLPWVDLAGVDVALTIIVAIVFARIRHSIWQGSVVSNCFVPQIKISFHNTILPNADMGLLETAMSISLV